MLKRRFKTLLILMLLLSGCGSASGTNGSPVNSASATEVHYVGHFEDAEYGVTAVLKSKKRQNTDIHNICTIKKSEQYVPIFCLIAGISNSSGIFRSPTGKHGCGIRRLPSSCLLRTG